MAMGARVSGAGYNIRDITHICFRMFVVRQLSHADNGCLVRGAVWGELVCGKTFPDLRDFSGNIAILGGRIGSVAVRQWRFPCLGHANSLNKKQGINFAVTGKL